MATKRNHLRVVDAPDAIEAFDPTPEETAKAERAKPLKRPICIRCKASPRIEIWQTVKLDIDKGFTLVIDLLTSPRVSDLTRDQISSVRNCHELLARASKARYCKRCVESVTSYVQETVEKMRT